MTARTTAISEIAAHRVAKTQDYLESAGADIYGQYVFDDVAQRKYLAKPIYQKLRQTIDGHEPFDLAIVDAVAHGGEGMGAGPGGHPLHALVRADDRLDRREARFVPDPDRRRQDDRRVLRPEPGPGRAGRELVPVGRDPGHVRGPRLHRLGRHVADLPPGRAERRHPHDPDGLRVVHRARPSTTRSRSCARRRRWASRRSGSCAGSATRAPSASSPTSAPSRSTSWSTAAWPSSGLTCCSPAARCSAPRRPRARSWRTSTSARSASGSWRS